MGGQVSLTFGTSASVMPQVRSGRLRALATTGSTRSPALPDIPTVAESGIPGYESDTYFGVFAPARTPKPIIAMLSRSLSQVVQLPDLKEQLAKQGAEPVGGDPEQLVAVVRSHTAKWEKVIRGAGLKIE